jgi:hypothetical protein
VGFLIFLQFQQNLANINTAMCVGGGSGADSLGIIKFLQSKVKFSISWLITQNELRDRFFALC